jgi:hypothetical protein
MTSLLVVFAVAGCGRTEFGASREEWSSPQQVPPAVDAGVVFIDRESYLCLPLERVGLPPDTHVTSIKASCDCVEPSLVKYVAPGGAVEKGLMLRFTAEPAGDSSSDRSSQAAMSLGVLVDLQLNDGTTHRFTVNLLHTTIAKEDSP